MPDSNPHIGSDALTFLASIIPDTPETQLVGESETFKFNLTQLLRHARKATGRSVEELAAVLEVDPEWVRQLEKIDSEHAIESVKRYLKACGVQVEVKIGAVVIPTERFVDLP